MRNVDISNKHFKTVLRVLRGSNIAEATEHLDAVSSMRRTLITSRTGRSFSGDHRHPKYPLKTIKVFLEIFRMLMSRIVNNNPKINSTMVFIENFMFDRVLCRNRPYRRAMGALDFLRTIRYDITLNTLVIANVK